MYIQKETVMKSKVHQIRNISQVAAFRMWVYHCPKTCQWMAAGFGTVIHPHSKIESPIHNGSVVICHHEYYGGLKKESAMNGIVKTCVTLYDMLF